MVEAGDALFRGGEETSFGNFPEQMVRLLGIVRK